MAGKTSCFSSGIRPRRKQSRFNLYAKQAFHRPAPGVEACELAGGVKTLYLCGFPHHETNGAKDARFPLRTRIDCGREHRHIRARHRPEALHPRFVFGQDRESHGARPVVSGLCCASVSQAIPFEPRTVGMDQSKLGKRGRTDSSRIVAIFARRYGEKIMWPNVSWENALRLVIDGFLLAVGWQAGTWIFAQFVGMPWIRRGASKQ